MSGDLTLNKYAAAILATALGFMLIKEVSHSAMHVEKPEMPAYALEMPKTGGEIAAPIDLPFPQATFVDAMNAEKGTKVFKKCTSCHTYDNGGKNGTGPNLWNIVGAPAGKNTGFTGYSGAMTNGGITWDYEALNDFLTKPKDYVSGTKMNFVGLKKEADRAAVIELLRLASDNPIAKPVIAAAPQESSEQEAELNEVIAEDNAAGELTETIEEGIKAQDAAHEKAVETVKGTVKDVVETGGDMIDDAKDKAGDMVDKIKEATEDNE